MSSLIFETSSYRFPEATALDFYGNELTVTTPFFEPSDGVGTYNFTYFATDQFGRTTFKDFTIEVVSANKPTFEVSDVSVEEDSGRYAASFITNANANDPGQEIDSYETINVSNLSLFSQSPAITADGVLIFTPQANGHGSSTVTVAAIDEQSDPNNGTSEPRIFTITVTSGDDPPVITPPIDPVVNENATASFAFSAVDPFGEAISYSLGGADSDFFSLTQSGSPLNFVSAQDFENPADQNGDNIYEVTIIATGSDGTSTSEVQVQVVDVNQTPTNLSLSTNRLVEGRVAVGLLSAIGEDGETPSFSVTGGVDQGNFRVSGSILSFLFPPQFNNPADHDGDNIYYVEATASSGALNSVPRLFAITVVSEDNQAPGTPLLTNDEVPENTMIVGALLSTDPDGDEITLSIAGGDDAALFEIVDGATLSFLAAPDYEAPADRNGDNIYELTVTATDGLFTSNEGSLSITVIDLFESAATDILLNGESVDEIALDENLPAGTLVGTLTVMDAEPGDTNTLVLTTDSNGVFEIINGNELIVTGSPSLNYEGDASHMIRIQASDLGGNTFTKRLEVTVIDVDEGSVFDREDYTLDTNTNQLWLHHEHTEGRTINWVEGNIENHNIFGTDYDWQFATWDEYLEFLQNAATYWEYFVSPNIWIFGFTDDYFNQDSLNSFYRSREFTVIALNEDGSYGYNSFRWQTDRFLYITPEGDALRSLRQQLAALGVSSVASDSQYADLLLMEGNAVRENSAVMYLLTDRTSGVGFDDWSSGQERSPYFDEDDNNDGQPVGLDYVFGAQKPMEMLSENQVTAPANTWHDIEIELLCSTDLQAWTTLLTYQGGSIVQSETELLAEGITVQNGVITHGNGGTGDQTFYRFSVKQFEGTDSP